MTCLRCLGFKQDEWVTCTKALDGYVTQGRSYRIQSVRQNEGRIVIKDDRGLEGWYDWKRFEFPGYF